MKTCAKKVLAVVSVFALVIGIMASCKQATDLPENGGGSDVPNGGGSGSGSTVVEVTEVKMSTTTLELTEGDTADLVITVTPENGNKSGLTWKSDNEEVVTVNSGKVTAKKPGTAKVTVTTKDGKSSSSCDITVLKKEITISFDFPKIKMAVGEERDLQVTFSSEPEDKTVTWKSDSPSYVSVDENGHIKVLSRSYSYVNITATWDDKTAKCTIDTIRGDRVVFEKIEAEDSPLTCEVADTVVFRYTLTPLYPTYDACVFSIEDETIATISESGMITGVKEGTTKATVTYYVMPDVVKSLTRDVVITKETTKIESIGFPFSKINLIEGSTFQLNPIINPADAENKEVVYTSSKTAIATVDETGVVTAVKASTSTYARTSVITVAPKVGKAKSATVSVEVHTQAQADAMKITSMELNTEKSDFTKPLALGETRTVYFKTNFKDNDSSLSNNINWSSSDPSIATYDTAFGVRAGSKTGTCTITATTIDGSLTLSFDVTVVATNSITIEKSKYEVAKGKTITIKPVVDPTGAKITATSSDTSVATVSSFNGTYTINGLKIGTVTITLESLDGVKATCEVEVIDAPDYYLDESDLDAISSYYDELVFTKSQTAFTVGFKEWDSTNKKWEGHNQLTDPVQFNVQPGTYSKEEIYDLGNVKNHTLDTTATYKVYKMSAGSSSKTDPWICVLYIVKEADWKN